MKNWTDKKVIVIGAARQGTALSRFLVNQGARVVLTDLHGPEALSAEALTLKDAGVELCLGSHPLELLEGADMVCVSGGVPLTIPFLQEAVRRRIQLSNDSQIFMEVCPAIVVGITGSAGKTTTTALLGLMARKFFEMKQSPRHAWVGGNIGNPLIEHVTEMQADDLVILELSSFQLELMTVSPQVAVVLNITPNHLDRHGTMQAYAAAKARILNYQHQGDVAVLNRDDAGPGSLQPSRKSDLISFGFNRPEGNQSGTYIHRDSVYLQIDRQQLKMFPVEWIQLRGQHNISNVLAACAAAAAASLALPAIQTAVEEFTGVPHRLEFVRTVRGADWYNDSIATARNARSPRCSLSGSLVLLLGGRDKDLPWEKLAEQVHSRVWHAVLFGEAAELISRALGTVRAGETLQSITQCANLYEAVQKAAELAQEGDTVLLSPGGTSYDAFKDFEERGESYRQWVNAL
jgi:UDP-N-acetylmuramoylalanine--D-glutamate ligase